MCCFNEEATLPPIHVTIQTPAGALRLAYLDVGSGRPLLLLHGMFGDHLDWAPVIEPLSQRFRVLAVDLPGFGDSEKPDADYDGSLFVYAIRGLLAHLQLPCVTLVGNSFGGLLALMFTLENPQSVDALVLVGSGGLQPFDEAARQRAERLFSESSLLALTPAMQDAMFSPVFATDSETRQRYLDKQNAKLDREDFRAYARALARTIRFVMRTSYDERLPEIQCRTLLLWGDRDAVIPAEVAVRAAGRIPRCRVKLLAGCGHAPQLDCPGAFTKAIEDFAGGRSAAV